MVIDKQLQQNIEQAINAIALPAHVYGPAEIVLCEDSAGDLGAFVTLTIHEAKVDADVLIALTQQVEDAVNNLGSDATAYVRFDPLVDSHGRKMPAK